MPFLPSLLPRTPAGTGPPWEHRGRRAALRGPGLFPGAVPGSCARSCSRGRCPGPVPEAAFQPQVRGARGSSARTFSRAPRGRAGIASRCCHPAAGAAHCSGARGAGAARPAGLCAFIHSHRCCCFCSFILALFLLFIHIFTLSFIHSQRPRRFNDSQVLSRSGASQNTQPDHKQLSLHVLGLVIVLSSSFVMTLILIFTIAFSLHSLM